MDFRTLLRDSLTFLRGGEGLEFGVLVGGVLDDRLFRRRPRRLLESDFLSTGLA